MNAPHIGRSLNLAARVVTDQTAERNDHARVSEHTVRDSG